MEFINRAASVRKTAARMLFGSLLDSINGLADEVSLLVPNYSHIVNDQTFNERLVKRQLLTHPNREPLEVKTGLLREAMMEAGRLHTLFGLKGGGLRNDSQYTPKLKTLDELYGAGRKALYVISACHVLVNLKGDSQQSKASDILAATVADLPAAVASRLRALM